jgi:hypothetical protein
MAPRTLIDD